VNALPAPSATAQNEELEQETDSGYWAAASTMTGAPHDVPFRRTAWPLASTAAQNAWLGHDTDVMFSKGSIFDAPLHAMPFQVKALPKASTTTQDEAPTQETELGWPADGSMFVGPDQLMCSATAPAGVRTAPTRLIASIREPSRLTADLLLGQCVAFQATVRSFVDRAGANASEGNRNRQ
jgi:hypothetical protein